MIGDAGLRRQLELLQKRRGHANDNIPLDSIYLVATNVEVAKIFNADAVGISSSATSRSNVHRAAGADHTIGEHSEVLRDVCIACVVDMVVSHILLQLEMVRAIELLVARRPSMMLLNYGNPASHLLLNQPSLKLSDCHKCKAILSLHSASAS